MASVRDATNVRWTVRRVWWPFGTLLLDLPEWGGLFAIGMLLTLPLVVIWPFWVLAHFLGAPWTLVVRRQGKEIRREKVKGWYESRQRMAGILDEARRQGSPEAESGATVY
ncbi:hypothetical protein [Candidatus Mycolicibacterium alkanivorans]|uniref:Uncharacterized protein n=1 Tax=Candidatus Mycolicibacterium alkanivorans TaxID=2954114 RepID=A0ABS9YYA1_9MYCO|nr:hypothetical protein [Candidatus Mycolicibacterium alkanivorans]MCI4676211.1 hypothetical protein [Candidatus Mycolicibacterium alkanivorans]